MFYPGYLNRYDIHKKITNIGAEKGGAVRHLLTGEYVYPIQFSMNTTQRILHKGYVRRPKAATSILKRVICYKPREALARAIRLPILANSLHFERIGCTHSLQRTTWITALG